MLKAATSKVDEAPSGAPLQGTSKPRKLPRLASLLRVPVLRLRRSQLSAELRRSACEKGDAKRHLGVRLRCKRRCCAAVRARSPRLRRLGPRHLLRALAGGGAACAAAPGAAASRDSAQEDALSHVDVMRACSMVGSASVRDMRALWLGVCMSARISE